MKSRTSHVATYIPSYVYFWQFVPVIFVQNAFLSSISLHEGHNLLCNRVMGRPHFDLQHMCELVLGLEIAVLYLGFLTRSRQFSNLYVVLNSLVCSYNWIIGFVVNVIQPFGNKKTLSFSLYFPNICTRQQHLKLCCWTWLLHSHRMTHKLYNPCFISFTTILSSQQKSHKPFG